MIFSVPTSIKDMKEYSSARLFLMTWIQYGLDNILIILIR